MDSTANKWWSYGSFIYDVHSNKIDENCGWMRILTGIKERVGVEGKPQETLKLASDLMQ